MIKQNFNQKWGFRNGLDNPMMAAFVAAAQGTTSVNLPFDAMLLSERKAENVEESGIGYFTPTNVEFEKMYTPKKDDEGKVIYLEFEGVYANAILEVSNQVVKRHHFGYSGFVAKISDYLAFGQPNKIKVTALNGIHPNGRYYTGTGIYRDVKLMVGEALHIQPDGVRLTTLDADLEVATIEVAVTVKNENAGHKKATVRTVLKTQDGENAVEVDTIFNVFSGEEIVIRQRMYLPEPQLWNADEPNLYTYETIIEDENGEIDCANGTFGVRTIRLDTVHGLRINGKTVKLKGGCIHSDNGVIGAVSVTDAEDRRIRMLKEAGYNAIRTSHNPVGNAILDACDKYGMLVMEEYADAWTHAKPTYDYSLWMEECWEEDIESMVRVAYNHPSVIMYSIGNEISDVGSDLAAHWGRRFCQKLKDIDSYRLITNGINVMMANLDKMIPIAQSLETGNVEVTEINNMMSKLMGMMPAINTHPISRNAIMESCEMLDVIGYNYASYMYKKDHEDRPNRIFCGSETNPAELDLNWGLVESSSYVIGDFAWTAWDYIGEPGIGRTTEDDGVMNVYGQYPWLLAYCGDFDLTGYRRPISYWREIIWGGRKHIPYISVHRPENIGKKMYISQWSWTDSIHSWTWPGMEGKTTYIEVYSDTDEVELIVNGNSMGKKTVGEDTKKFYCKWEVCYEPGVVEAIAYINECEVGRQILQTAKNAELLVNIDKKKLRASSNELSFLEIEYRDEKNNLDMAIDRTVEIRTEGPIEVLGAGSGNPKTEERYIDQEHQIFEGRMLAVIRAKEEAGYGKILIIDNTGKRVELQIEVE
ncbi:glycoside hydrolase family 2 protein [Clostridium sp. AF19-22AC]|uniref:glycoside hydrolase family 2 protein n=1 Tax=Clostridia TaxID=186801 RepID=UPI000E4C422E|nr:MULTISPECIES: glycoside hydrolase family 2 TIM barrel-domain containing protein [Clostridia]RHR22570.1 glycoside hydrolase family 2 protein [Clostridium sp. AF19-22AC]